jgi:hypothetical protein
MRGTLRLHYKPASGTLNSATWRYVSVMKHTDRSLHSVAETYKKEKISVTLTPELPREETFL